MALTESGNVPDEYIQYALAGARLSLRAQTVFAPGDPGFSTQVLDLVDMTGDGAGLDAVFGRYGTVTASDGAEGVDYAGWQAFDPTTTTVTAVKHNAGVKMTWERLKKSKSEIGEWAKAGIELGRALASLVNTDVCTAFSSFTNTTTDTGNDITFDDITTAIDELHGRDVEGQMYLTIPWRWWSDLIKESSTPLTDASKTQLAEGFYNRYFFDDALGLVWFITNDCPSINAGADRQGALFTAEAIGMSWAKDIGIDVTWDPDSYTWKLLGTAYWGVGIASDDCGEGLEFDA